MWIKIWEYIKGLFVMGEHTCVNGDPDCEECDYSIW